MRIPTCPLAHQQINLLSLDRCSWPKRALICETEPLLSAVVRKRQQKSPDNWEEGGRRMKAHNGRSTSPHPQSLTDSFQWALNLLFSPLWYWKGCFFSVQHIMQCNIMKPEARGSGMITLMVLLLLVLFTVHCFCYLDFCFIWPSSFLIAFRQFFLSAQLFLFVIVLYVWQVLHK